MLCSGTFGLAEFMFQSEINSSRAGLNAPWEISAVFNATPRTYATSSETTRDCDFESLLIFEMSEDGFEILNLLSICSSRFSICEYSFFDPSSYAFTVQIVSMHENCSGETDFVHEANNAIKNAGTRK